MKERPILFSGPMVRAILGGRKSQTRRIIKKPEWYGCPTGDCPHQTQYECDQAMNDPSVLSECPYGGPGDRLWVRETFRVYGDEGRFKSETSTCTGPQDCEFASDFTGEELTAREWRPSIHMPRWACRITLEVVSVRTERLQQISEADAIAEGVQSVRDHYGDPSIPLMHCGTVAWQRYDGAACAAPSAQMSYQSLWESINGPTSWKANPYVWVVEFKRLEAK